MSYAIRILKPGKRKYLLDVNQEPFKTEKEAESFASSFLTNGEKHSIVFVRLEPNKEMDKDGKRTLPRVNEVSKYNKVKDFPDTFDEDEKLAMGITGSIVGDVTP